MVDFVWGGTQQTLSNTIAINQALQVAGIQVDGFDYQWVYKNGNANWFLHNNMAWMTLL